MVPVLFREEMKSLANTAYHPSSIQIRPIKAIRRLGPKYWHASDRILCRFSHHKALYTKTSNFQVRRSSLSNYAKFYGKQQPNGPI